MSLVEQSVTSDRLIELGEIKAAYGIKGWVKLFSWTRPKEQILDYSHWLVGSEKQWQRFEVENSVQRGNNALVAKFSGIDDRDAALALYGKTIAIFKSELPELDAGEYYWSQLIGLEVVNLQHESLGKVTGLQETGANDVLVINHDQGTDLIPYGAPVVQQVNLDIGQIVVDWVTDK